jgi:hypothetical protein
MADDWNPFDPNNVVYKKLAKQSGMQRKQVRNTVIVGGILLAGYFASKNKNRLPIGFFGTAPLDGLGLVRRK